MMKIYKYQLTNSVTYIRGKIARFLTVQMQRDIPCVWAIVDDSVDESEFALYMIGTGWDMNDIKTEEYVGTIQECGCVWHWFARRQEQFVKTIKNN